MWKDRWLMGAVLAAGVMYVIAAYSTQYIAKRRAAEPICFRMELGYGKSTGEPYSEARYRACIDREAPSRPCSVDWRLSASCSDFS
ncbi:TPA: hypothetical protein QDB02_002830 [Burkholderia vietnamiensis]|nr:hypothetical protein [Burkholderia vietnamiensis]